MFWRKKFACLTIASATCYRSDYIKNHREKQTKEQKIAIANCILQTVSKNFKLQILKVIVIYKL